VSIRRRCARCASSTSTSGLHSLRIVTLSWPGECTPHEFARAAIQRGTPPEQAHLMERLNEVFRARRSVAITDDVENITGTAPATFRDWCERHADAFR